MSRHLIVLAVVMLTACASKRDDRTAPAPPPAPAPELATACKATCDADGSTYESTQDGQCVCARTPTGTTASMYACTDLGCAQACAPGSCAGYRLHPNGNCVFYCILRTTAPDTLR